MKILNLIYAFTFSHWYKFFIQCTLFGYGNIHAFGSGFLSGFIKTNDVSFAIQLGIANAISCIQKIGAKNGLLKGLKKKEISRIKVKKRKL